MPNCDYCNNKSTTTFQNTEVKAKVCDECEFNLIEAYSDNTPRNYNEAMAQEYSLA